MCGFSVGISSIGARGRVNEFCVLWLPSCETPGAGLSKRTRSASLVCEGRFDIGGFHFDAKVLQVVGFALILEGKLADEVSIAR